MSQSKQLWAHVAALHRKFPDTRVFGIRTQFRWPEGDTMTVGEMVFLVRHCQSPLEVREAILETEAETRSVVILTELDEVSLGQDLLTYFGRRRLFEIEVWSLLKELFAARAIDPRIYGRKWMAQTLLDLVPFEGYAPVLSGVLTVERVWEVLLDRALGLTAGRPDAVDLLRWTMSDDAARFIDLGDEFKGDLKAWLNETAGPLGEVVLGCIQEGHAKDAVSIGMACEVIFAEIAAPPPSLGQAAVRLERFTGGRPVPPAVGRQWSHAARQVAEHFGDEPGGVQEKVVARGDEIIGEVGAAALAHLSDISPLGYHQRVETLGKALLGSEKLAPPRQILEAEAAARQVLASWPGQAMADRSSRIEMALRLLRWLATDPTHDIERDDLASIVTSYVADGGFVDWAREALVVGDSHSVLAQAYEKLRVEAGNKREQMNARFARLLAVAEGRVSTETKLVPVEQFLDDILTPFAAQFSILLITMDGLSWGVFRELLEDLSRQGWQQICLDGQGVVTSLLAGFPSITKISRSSLLSGETRVGTAADEKIKFQSHRRLKEAGRATHPPVLFHKGDLGHGGSTSLPSLVSEEIRSSQRRVVGVVLNAVDDQLAKGEQVFIAWTLQALPLLKTLLDLAREAGRVVVFASDHGHVLDRGTDLRLYAEDGERYRRDDGTLMPDEISLSGPRVLLSADGKVVMPWSEKVRYKARKNGYHGGTSLQEMVVPAMAMHAGANTPAGWKAVPSYEPAWWQGSLQLTVAPVPMGFGVRTGERQASDDAQIELLFSLETT